MASMQQNQPLLKVAVERNLPMRTRDGVVLYADVYRPDAPGRFPVLLVRTPYDKSMEIALTEKDFFPPRGYVLVVQDTRGRFTSEGEFRLFVNEGHDGYDAIEWAAGLPWSDGQVGMVGQSYLALTQYYAAVEAPPHLRAICPVSGPVTYYENCVYRHGVFELGWMLGYLNMMSRNTLDRKGLLEDQQATLDGYLEDPAVPLSAISDAACRHLPVADWGERLADGAPDLRVMLANWKNGPYWSATDVRPRLGNLTVPALHAGSWYDAFQYDTLEIYSRARKTAGSDRARRLQRLVMGPWAHLLPYGIPTSTGTGDIDFGPAAIVELHAIQEQWFRRVFAGQEERLIEEPPIRIFVIGDNRWRDEWEWPLARTVYTDLFLRGGGRANSLNGDGSLSASGPSDETPHRFIYDPENPVPTRGGRVLGLKATGVYDQREVERRDDVLVYTGELLGSELELTGPVRLHLFAASTAPDTDFTAKLCDVRPDGYSQNIAEGVVRARFRESTFDPTLIKPGAVYEYVIDLWAVCHVLKRGHRLRLEISSSNFPHWDRNPNSGHDLFVDGELRTAQQTIFHDAARPSHLVLPVIPR